MLKTTTRLIGKAIILMTTPVWVIMWCTVGMLIAWPMMGIQRGTELCIDKSMRAVNDANAYITGRVQ